MGRAIEKGQHIFIAFQDGKAVLDSQLRPRMYKSKEQFEKSFPAWRDGVAEPVEYVPVPLVKRGKLSKDEKLIERLRKYSQNLIAYKKDADACAEATAALSALQAENAQLCVKLEQQKEYVTFYQGIADKNLEAAKAFKEELEQVRREKDAAVECCRGYCESCAFERDCAKHDMNDAAPTRWYYGDCEDWEWRGPEEG